MKRRRFLEVATVGSAVALSGCSGVPFLNTQLPTSEQEPYLTHYPPADQVSEVSRITFTYRQDGLYVRPVVYDDFETFILFTVNKRGSGEEITRRTIQQHRESDLKPFVVDKGTVTGGTILLVVGETADGSRYTQTAVYYDGESEQLEYPLSASSQSDETNTTSQ